MRKHKTHEKTLKRKVRFNNRQQQTKTSNTSCLQNTQVSRPTFFVTLMRLKHEKREDIN